jgi:hypothetical protein
VIGTAPWGDFALIVDPDVALERTAQKVALNLRRRQRHHAQQNACGHRHQVNDIAGFFGCGGKI